MSTSFYDVVVLGSDLAATVGGAVLAHRGFRVLMAGVPVEERYTIGPYSLPRAPLAFVGIEGPDAQAHRRRAEPRAAVAPPARAQPPGVSAAAARSSHRRRRRSRARARARDARRGGAVRDGGGARGRGVGGDRGHPVAGSDPAARRLLGSARRQPRRGAAARRPTRICWRRCPTATRCAPPTRCRRAFGAALDDVGRGVAWRASAICIGAAPSASTAGARGCAACSSIV